MINPLSQITTLFLDIGGVLLTNGWDHNIRMRAAEKFGLDYDEMNERHHLTFDTYEQGKLSLDEQVHHEVVVAEVVVCDQHAVREPEGGVLPEVRDLGAPAGAVADRGHDLVGGVADDDADLLDPGLDHVFDAVEEDRLVGDRHELLRARVR